MPTRRNARPDWVLHQQRQLGFRIAVLREQREWSQERLAERAGMDRRSIQRYEAGRRDPRFSDMLLIAHAFGIHPKELLNY